MIYKNKVVSDSLQAIKAINKQIKSFYFGLCGRLQLVKILNRLCDSTKQWFF